MSNGRGEVWGAEVGCSQGCSRGEVWVARWGCGRDEREGVPGWGCGRDEVMS